MVQMVLRNLKTTLGRLMIASIPVLLAIQLVPYGRAHENPPIADEPDWVEPHTRELAERACFDCHSNETRWPWYAHVAPASWLVQSHVDEGRRILNFSEWQRPYEEASESSEAVLEREMPPRSYLLAHAAARLTAAEREALARGLAKMTAGGAKTAESAEE
jgi:hypothetical protein